MYTYNISNRRSAVREVKKYLYLISENLYDSIPRTTVDGVFDNETTRAVAEFQRIKGIEISGVVDYLTFTLLFLDYSELVKDIESADFILEGEDFPFKLGDFSQDVNAINMLINELGKTYTELPYVRSEKYFSHDTEKAILLLRDIFLIDGDGVVDKKMYCRMKKELSARRLADKKY